MIRLALAWVLALFPVAVSLITVLSRERPTRLIPRYLVVLLVLLAIARPSVSIREDERRVMFLIDRSASVANTTDETETLTQVQAIVNDNPLAQFGSIEFARNSVLVSLPGAFDRALPPGRVVVTGTRLVKAVQLALTILSPASGGQIVLASDGRFTDDADEAVALADIAGVPISVLPIGEPIDTDVVLSSITAPREVSLDRPFTVSVAIESSLAATAQLAIYREGSLIGLSNVPLEQGLNRFSFADTVSDPGLYTYQAVARSEDDPVSENDTLLVSVRSTTQPDVLLVEGGDGSAIPDLLDAISLRYVIVESVPDLATLSSYNQLILSEVPLGDLTDGQATSIDRFVRNLGGGMLVVQGEASVRGFTTTKVEHLLPISSITPETEQEASLALVYVLDRSSSMSALVNAKAKIRILRDAVAASAVLLPGRALVGVIGFDTDHDWLIPISPVGDATTVYGMLRKLRAYGGTDLFYPLVDALDALRGVEARSKHILLISDGKTSNEPRDYPGLLSQLEETEDVTLSVIALGDDPRLGLLSSLVESGRGSLYHVSDFSRLPAVTLQVTQRLSRSRFVLEETQVGGPLVRLLADDPPPTIDGYVLTYPRATSQTLLTAGVDPLAATWRVGLGSVTVLNTDLTGAWSGSWLSWSGLSGLFAEVLRTTEPFALASTGLFPSVALEEDGMRVLVDARDGSGQFVDHLTIETRLLPNDLGAEASQVGPGLYSAAFSLPAEGAYALQINDLSRGRTVAIPVTVPYPAEYRATGPDRDTLDKIAANTGGAVLSERAFELPEIPLDRLREYVPIHPYLLLAALALFLAELIGRKLPRRLPERPIVEP